MYQEIWGKAVAMAVTTAGRGRCISQRVVSESNHHITADIGLVVSSTITALAILSTS